MVIFGGCLELDENKNRPTPAPADGRYAPPEGMWRDNSVEVPAKARPPAAEPFRWAVHP